MAFQMVYTSVRSGLVAGRSGFCTAARHREIKESLVARLEDFSAQYDRGIAAGGTPPIVYQHRIVTIRDQRHHVLMRLGDAGNDYTGRTNHIAHCLVVEPSEIEGLSISPAEAILALSQRGFWRNHYDESAQFFGVGDLIDLGTLPRIALLPATRWRERTGSSANAALLFESGGPMDAGLAVSGTGEADAARILALFAESLLLLDPDRSSGTALWSVPFTTVLQSSAERSQFRWCGIVADSPAIAQESRAGRRILSSGSPLNPPSSALADIAEGRPPRLEPAAAIVAEQATAGAMDPREPALGSNPSADAEQERPVYVVPLSLEDPRRRSRATKSRKNPARTALLSAAVVISVLAMAGGVWFWSGNKEVWEEERRIGEMVDEGSWEEIYRNFKTREPKSKRLAEWKGIAEAIARYKEIEESPHQFADTVPGADSVDDAIGKIREEWEAAKIDSSEPLRKQVEDARGAADASADKWSPIVQDVISHSVELRALLGARTKSTNDLVKRQATSLARSIDALENDCKKWSTADLKSEGQLLKLVEESILPALLELERIDREYQINEDLKDPAAEASKFLTRLLEQSPKPASKGGLETKFRKEVSEVCNNLIERLQKLSHADGFAREEPPSVPAKAEPPKPDPAVTAAAEAKKDKIPPKTILINAGTDGVIDFSTIEGAPPTLPETFEIFPLSSFVSIDAVAVQLSKRSGSKDSYKYYDDKTKVILRNPGELKLKKDVKTEFWNSFSGGFILLPKGEGLPGVVRYLVLDPIPGDQGSTGLHPFLTMPNKEFIKQLPTDEVTISKRVAEILAKTELAGGGSLKYRLTLALAPRIASHRVEDPSVSKLPLAEKENEELLAVEEQLGGHLIESDQVDDPSAIKLPLAEKVKEELESVEAQKAQHDSVEKAHIRFESSYANLGKELFPQFFEPNPEPGEKVIVDKKNPRRRSDSPKVTATYAEFVDKESGNHLDGFTKYVVDLFEQLNELAGGDPRHAGAKRELARLITSPRDLKSDGILTPEAVGWVGVTKLSNDPKNRWSEPDDDPYAPPKEGDEQILKQIHAKYFEDFFRRWNERFSKEAVTTLIQDLESIQKVKALPSLAELDSKIKRLKNEDLTDDGEYTLELVIETPNPNSPTIIPLIRGTR
jgi:hypothetical protein